MIPQLIAIANQASRAHSEIRQLSTDILVSMLFNFDRETHRINRSNGQSRRRAAERNNKELSHE